MLYFYISIYIYTNTFIYIYIYVEAYVYRVPMKCGWPVTGTALSGRAMVVHCGVTGDGALD